MQGLIRCRAMCGTTASFSSDRIEHVPDRGERQECVQAREPRPVRARPPQIVEEYILDSIVVTS